MATAKDVLMGNVCNNSHPAHPATIHLPLAFLLTASTLDIIHLIGLHAPGLLSPLASLTTGSPSPISLLYHVSLYSYAATIAGLVTSLPAIATGSAELFSMLQKRGLDDPVTKRTLVHAGLNAVGAVGAAWNWWTRRGREGFVADTSNGVVSVGMLGGSVVAAYLGGSLIYTYGVGVQRMGKGVAVKEGKQGEKKGKGKGVVGGKKEL